MNIKEKMKAFKLNRKNKDEAMDNLEAVETDTEDGNVILSKIKNFAMANIKAIAVVLIIILLIGAFSLNNFIQRKQNERFLATYYQDQMMKDVQVINEKYYSENKNAMYDDIIKELQNSNMEINGDLTEEQINALIDLINENLYSNYSEIFDQDSFNQLVRNIIEGANQYTSKDEFLKKVEEFINVHNEYDELIKNIQENYELSDEELKKLITELSTKTDGSVEELTSLIKKLTDDSESADEEIKKLIEEADSKLTTDIKNFSDKADKDLNDLSNKTDERIAEIKSKKILVGDYDESTNTLTIEEVEWQPEIDDSTSDSTTPNP